MNKLVKRSARTFPSIFDELFNNEQWGTMPSQFRATVPSVNIKENEDAFTLEFAIPGLNKEDIKIELEDSVLTISSEVSNEEKSENEKFTRKEFSYSSFKRSFNLPDTVDEAKIDATQKNGVLSIALPKKEEAKPQPPKAIEIK